MYYYYEPKNGELTSSTRQMQTGTRLNELQYQIGQLMIAGYSKEEINAAVNLMFILLQDRIDN